MMVKILPNTTFGTHFVVEHDIIVYAETSMASKHHNIETKGNLFSNITQNGYMSVAMPVTRITFTNDGEFRF